MKLLDSSIVLALGIFGISMTSCGTTNVDALQSPDIIAEAPKTIQETGPLKTTAYGDRRIVASARMYVVDHESFGSNEIKNTYRSNQMILNYQNNPSNTTSLEARAGGEVRIELDLDTILNSSEGAIVQGELRLYEGTSDSSNDLDGIRHFSMYIPKGAIGNSYIRIDNDDEGGDYAKVWLNIYNINP